MARLVWSAVFGCLLLVSLAQANTSVTIDSSIEFEQRLFLQSDQAPPLAPLPTLSQGQSSVRLRSEIVLEWRNGDNRLVIEPYLRLDAQDEARTHFDFRQLIWSYYGSNYEISAGLGQVFWGVTESQQLLDIINQSDGVENIDGEDNLGQAMIRYNAFGAWGSVDAFILPYFHRRTFVGEDSRLNGGIIVDNDRAEYQSSRAQSHIDLAFRYNKTIGDWDIGLSVFDGTSREPDLLRNLDFATGRTIPFYPQITQYGADVQLTTGSWLLKLEAIERRHNDPVLADFAAATLGFEYTFVGVFNSIYDLGVLSEYLWDERGENATNIFQNDLFIGARLALNDIADTTLLLGITSDFDNSDSQSVFLEGATRLTNSMTANIELRYFASDTPNDILFRLRNDSFIQIGIEYYF